MNVRLLEPAQKELDDAFSWYEQQVPGLGSAFLDELDRAVRRVAAFPHVATEIDTGIRRALMRRFPYGIVYGQDADAIVIIAVAHLHREPRYWVDRLLNQGTQS